MIHFYLNSYNTPACKVICAEIVTQDLPHRSSANFKVIKLYLNPCKIRLLEFFYSLWRQGQPGGGLRNVTLCGASDTQTCIAKCGSCLSLGYPLRRSCVLDGQTCGVVKCENSLPAATVCRSCVSNAQACGGMYITLCRDRAGRASKHVAKCKFGGTRRSPFARNEGQPSKMGVKL